MDHPLRRFRTFDECGSVDLWAEQMYQLAAEAIRQEVEQLEREGLPVWVWRDGRVVDATGKHPPPKPRKPEG